MRKIILSLALISLVAPMWGFFYVNSVSAADRATINFFYSETCPHCHREQGFLDELQKSYGDRLEVNRYSINKFGTAGRLRDLAEEYGAADAVGVVPLTFVGAEYFVGFDSAEGQIGQGIISAVETELARPVSSPEPEPQEDPVSEEKTVNVPFIGSINTSDYSLPALAVVLGALDGFNVCSLGALILILGLTLELKSRKKIMLYGSLFILTTAIIYGVLIHLWYQLFSAVQGYLGTLSLIIGILGIIGGVYFFKEFLRMRKVGLICKTTGASFVDKAMKKTEEVFSRPNRLFYLGLAVVAFAAVVAIVEFPCSAAIPVAFAGIMADMGISGLGQFFLLSIFVFFYMLDELLIFIIAAWQMKLALTSPNFTIWATFAESIFLFALGAYYLSGIL